MESASHRRFPSPCQDLHSISPICPTGQDRCTINPHPSIERTDSATALELLASAKDLQTGALGTIDLHQKGERHSRNTTLGVYRVAHGSPWDWRTALMKVLGEGNYRFATVDLLLPGQPELLVWVYADTPTDSADTLPPGAVFCFNLACRSLQCGDSNYCDLCGTPLT